MNTAAFFNVLEEYCPVPDHFRSALKKELTQVIFPKYYFLQEAGSVPDRSYFINKGFCISFYYEEDEKIVTGFFQSGEIIVSPKSFFDHQPATEFIQALEKSEVLCLSYGGASRLCDSFQVANQLARSVISDLHYRSTLKIASLRKLSAWERYAKLKLDFPRIEQKVPQDHIASFLGITPQSLSRLKHQKNKPDPPNDQATK